MKKNFNKIVLSLIVSAFLCSSFLAKASSIPEAKIEPGTYVLVSFSMNDASLRSYFIEAQNYGAKLAIRGLVGEKNARNKFRNTKTRIEKARINVDINPNLFEAMNVKQVPVIAVVANDGSIKKIAGHISIKAALELMEIEQNEDQRK